MGNITINGGTIYAAGGSNGGASYVGGTVTINGGNIIATGGGTAADIGGAGTTVTITGGNIIATKNVISPQPTNGIVPVYRVACTLPVSNTPIAAANINTANYGVKDVIIDANSKLYFYLPQNAETVVRVGASDMKVYGPYSGYYANVTTDNSATAILDLTQTFSDLVPVTYLANGATRGTVPAPTTYYIGGGRAFGVSGNTGGLAKTGYVFGGWSLYWDGGGWGTTGGVQQGGSTICTQAYYMEGTLTAVWLSKNVVVTGTQSGTLTHGEAGSATYSVTTEHIANGTYSVTLGGSVPASITATAEITNNTGILTLNTTSVTPAGVYSGLTAAIDTAANPGTFALTIAESITPAPLTGVISPDIGETPLTSINAGTGFTSALAWNSVTTFAMGGTYTATITLTATGNYVFSTNLNSTAAISGFTVNGIAPEFVSNDGSELVLTVTFPALVVPLIVTTGDAYTYAGRVLTLGSGTYDISLHASLTTTNHYIVVSDNATAAITLNGVVINYLGSAQPALSLGSGATVVLNLADGTTSRLTGGSHGAGICVPPSATLTIEGNTGTLFATGSRMGAGIGGSTSVNYSSGNPEAAGGIANGIITIYGGTITAAGGYQAAGIGGATGGYSVGYKADAANAITINGGMVTATGGQWGAGIGGGRFSTSYTIINGGTVTANGGAQSAGIGNGYEPLQDATTAVTTITGGNVTATGGSGGSGIGGAAKDGSGDARGGNITISGGMVKATGNGGDGIGAGSGASSAALIITGGSVAASSTAQATNGEGATVFLNTLTVGSAPVANTSITAGRIAGVACAATADATSGVYGIKDVKTAGDGKVYFYLPQSDGNEVVRLTANSTEYGYKYARTTTATQTLSSPIPTCVSYTAVQTGGANGTATSTGITLTFSDSVSGLTNITITPGTGAAVTGTLSGSATTYTIPLTSVTTQGDVKVGIADFGSYVIENGNRTVALFKDGIKPTVASVSPSGTGISQSTTALSVTFDEDMDATAGTVTLSPATGLTLTFNNWTNGNTTANYILSGLNHNTTYTYTTISGFKDKAGNEMEADNGRTFETQTPQTITAATYSAAPYSVGHQITATAGTYTANNGGTEGTHTYKWYRADDNSGTGSAEISSATALAYTPVAADFSKYICIETTPVGVAGLPSVAVKSDWIQVGVTLLAGAVSGTQTTGATITVAGVASTVVYSSATVALTKPYASDVVAWSVPSAGGSFANASDASTTYTPPTAPTGDITLNATLDKGAASDITFPTYNAITYGAALSTSSPLSSGTTGRGSFAWQAGTTIPPVVNSGYAVEFIPNDLACYDYSGVTGWNGSTQKVLRTVTITVNKKDVTVSITANSKEYDSTTAATLSDTTLMGKLSADDLYLTGGTILFADKHKDNGKQVTFSGYALDGTDAGNYSLASGSTQATTTANITALPVTVSITADNKVYDGTTAATLSDTTLTGKLSADDLYLTGGTILFADKHKDNGKQVTFSGYALDGADAGNYSLAGGSTQATTMANITAAPITITVNNQGSVIYGATITPAYTTDIPLYSGDVFIGTLGIGGSRSTSGNLTTGSHNIVPGTLAISDGNGGNNYDTTFVSKSFTVNKLPLTHNVAVTSTKVYDGTAAATHSGDLTNVINNGTGSDNVTLAAA